MREAIGLIALIVAATSVSLLGVAAVAIMIIAFVLYVVGEHLWNKFR